MGKLFLPCALAVEDIAEALDEDMTRSEHIGQLSDLLRVFDRLIERHIEVVRAKDCKIGIVGFQLLIGMSVDDGEIVVVILLTDKAAGILTEGAHLVFERLRIPDQLRLIQHRIDLFHNLVANLDAHADIDRARHVIDVVVCAGFFQPFRAAASRRHNGSRRKDFKGFLSVRNLHTEALAVLDDDIRALIAEKDIDAMAQKILFDGIIEVLRLFRSEMADRAVHKLEPRLNRTLADILFRLIVGDALHVLVRTELQIDFIRIINRSLHDVLPDKSRQVAAHLIAERKLAVGKRARAGKTRRDMAVRLAAHAPLCFFLRAVTVFNRTPLFDDRNFLPASLSDHFNRGKNPRRTCADDDNIRFHVSLPYPFSLASTLSASLPVCFR